MEYYPVFLDLKGKNCTVIGGGKVAERKVITLLPTKARIYVVSPDITPKLKKLHEQKKIFHINSDYHHRFLQNTFLVIAATSDPDINSLIWRQASKKGLLINSVDNPAECNFIVPARVKKGDLIIAVSTCGKAPCMAKQIKQEINKLVSREFAERTKILAKVRSKLKNKYSASKKKQILNKLSKLSLAQLKKQKLVKTSFTLVEMIVVIAIIAVLAAIVVPSAFRAIEKSKISKAAEDMKSIKTAAMAYYTDTGSWPLLGLGGSVRASGRGFLTDDDGTGSPVPGWDGPYLDKWPTNPWGDPSSSFGNFYYWDADFSGDDNGDGITGEAQVIMFNVPRPSAQALDDKYDNGSLLGSNVGFIYQNQVVSGSSSTVNPVTINWMVHQPTR